MTDQPNTKGREGLFIVFEGGEGAGKTTQAKLLADALRKAGATVTATREPGGTRLGSAIRALLLAPWPDGGIPAHAEALLFLADRAAHAQQVIWPALRRDEIVISDRYADSTSVYQGLGRGLGTTHLASMSRWATNDLEPDLVIVLDIPPQIGLARSRRLGDPDRIEQETLDFHEQVRAGFLRRAELAENHRTHLAARTRYVVFDATLPEQHIAAAVLDAVAPLLADTCPMTQPA